MLPKHAHTRTHTQIGLLCTVQMRRCLRWSSLSLYTGDALIKLTYSAANAKPARQHPSSCQVASHNTNKKHSIDLSITRVRTYNGD
jgi:hypothetical protein